MYDTTYPTEEKIDILFKRGDIIFNSTPSVGGVVGWICVTGGNSGTWKALVILKINKDDLDKIIR